MKTLVTRSLAANRGRLTLTLVAVTLSVSFVTASFVLADSLRSVFADVSTAIYHGVDAEIRAGNGEFDRLETGRRFPVTSLDGVEEVEGVDTVVPVLGGRNEVFTTGADGEVLRPQGPPVLTFSTFGDSAVSPFTTISGAAPHGREVMLDHNQAVALGAEVGDPVTVATPRGIEQYVLSGTVTFGATESGVIPYFLLFDLGTVQELLDAPGTIDSASIAFESGADPAAVLSAIEAALPDSLLIADRAELVDEQNGEFGQVIDIIQIVLLIFAALALLVSTFVIANTFAVLVGRRRRQLGLLRAIGATRTQAALVIVSEAVLIGLIASVLGLGGGILIAEGIKTLFESVTTGGFPEGPTRILGRTVAISVTVGVVVTVMSALVPARRAGRISPIEAMRSDTSAPAASRVLPVGLLGVVASAVGARLGTPGRLAASGVTRNPRRVLTTSMSMIVGLGLIGGASVLAASYRATIGDTIATAYDADLVVTGDDGAAVPYGALVAVSELAEVDGVSGFGHTEVRLGEQVVPIVGFQSATADGVVVLDAVDGSVAPLGSTEAVVTTEFAEDHPTTVGDTIPLGFSDGAVVELVVRAIVEPSNVVDAGLLVDAELVAAHARNVDADFAAVRLAAGADPDQAVAAVADVLGRYPQLVLDSMADHLAGREAQAQQLLMLANGLLALTVVIALTGIANTVTLTTLERRTELGLLRAVGMSRRQLRAMVRHEAMLLALVGTVTGLTLGVVSALAISPLLPESLVARVEIPFGSIAIYLAIGVVFGVLAAVAPARRAAKLDVLTALQPAT